MRYFLTIFALFVFASQSPATMTFEKWFGGTDDDWGWSVAQTTDGGYIITGKTKSYGAGEHDVYLVKTDSLGDSLWTKTYGGGSSDYGYSVAQTTDGGYIITGYTESYGAGLSDVYLIKTDENGDTLWTKTFGGTDRDKGYSVAQTTDGGYIIAGWTGSYGADGWDVYLIKTDSNGDTLWAKTFGGTDWDEGYSVAQTTDGGYIIAGLTTSYGAGRSDVYLIKTNSSGNTSWTKTFGGAYDDFGLSVAQTTDGGYIIAGLTGGSYGAGDRDVYLIKTDENGDMLWAKTFGGTDWDGGFSVAQTTDGGYIIAGYTYSYGAGDRDVYLIKTDENGDTSWTKTFGGPDYDGGYSVQQTSDGGFILTGYTESYGAGYSDVYLIKTDGSGNVVGIEEREESEIRITKSEIYVHPNPFMSVATIESQVSNIQIFDLSGRLVETVKDNIIGKNLKPGIYFLKAKGHKPVRVVKLR